MAEERIPVLISEGLRVECDLKGESVFCMIDPDGRFALVAHRIIEKLVRREYPRLEHAAFSFAETSLDHPKGWEKSVVLNRRVVQRDLAKRFIVEYDEANDRYYVVIDPAKGFAQVPQESIERVVREVAPQVGTHHLTIEYRREGSVEGAPGSPSPGSATK